MTRAILILSHLALIPLGASAAEIWAMSDLLQTVDEARTAKPSLDVRIVWTRFRGHTKAAQELSAEVKKSISLPTIKAHIGYRVAYPDALARGLSVMEWHDQSARDEMEGLMNEVQRIVARR
jgi:chromosome partitioning protein